MSHREYKVFLFKCVNWWTLVLFCIKKKQKKIEKNFKLIYSKKFNKNYIKFNKSYIKFNKKV